MTASQPGEEDLFNAARRVADPAARAAFLHPKAELFTRLTADPALSAAPPAPGRGTP